jgi:hypothetical protein
VILTREKPRVRQLRDGTWTLRWERFVFVGETMDEVCDAYYRDLWGGE